VSRRFTNAEVKLARRIVEKLDKERWEAACSPQEPLSVKEWAQRIMDAPLQPSYGPTPPWWEQAVAEADQGLVWVEGGGWMPQVLWNDILQVSAEMAELEKECEDDD
jgi:hypothetical protein